MGLRPLSTTPSPDMPTPTPGPRPWYLHKLIVADEVSVREDLADGDGVDLLVACEGEGQGGSGTSRGQAQRRKAGEPAAPRRFLLASEQAWVCEDGRGRQHMNVRPSSEHIRRGDAAYWKCNPHPHRTLDDDRLFFG